ncbi:MAG: winged helix-turn-helix transcriptional regulator [Planctomycetes bacterium]|nr:winged helix-turn-helix transcriptional regulator [Planctomycetota bacterium]
MSKLKVRSSGRRCCADMGKLLEPRFFKALSDPNRIALLSRLAKCRRPCGVSELVGCCGVDISVVSRHLALLRDAGILRAEKRGKEVYYSVRCEEVVSTLRRIADAIEACCPKTKATRGERQ